MSNKITNIRKSPDELEEQEVGLFVALSIPSGSLYRTATKIASLQHISRFTYNI